MPRDEKNGRFVTTHGSSKSRLYQVWCAMKERCNNPHNKSFKNYGGKGVRVCGEWANDFKSFAEWAMANGYHESLTIDRIDGKGWYSPENCRWVTHREQNRNYSRNHFLTYDGVTLCLADMADKYGVNRATLIYRLKKGLPLEKALRNVDGRSERWKKTIS